MNDHFDLERRVAALVAAEGAAAPPVRVLDEIITATSRQRPLPRWLALIKEPPMRVSSHLAVGSPTARLVSVTALTSILILAVAAAGIAATNLLQGPTATLDRWAFQRGDAERRGEGGHGPLGTLQERWRFDAGAGVRQPTVADGIVYAVSDDGLLFALDEATGAELWKASDVNSHASIVDGLVVVGSPDGTVRALDARSGSERWATPPLMSGDVGAGLDADDTTVYVAMTGAFVALDLSDGTERWRHADPTYGEVHRPALSDGVLYAGTNSGGLVAVDADTGVLRWQADTGIDLTGTAVATDGIAYLGASSGGGPGRLYAFDAGSGSLLWAVGEMLFSPSVSDGIAISGSVSGAVTARDTQTGEELWRFQAGGMAFPPGVADGVVYVPAADGRIHALDSATGAELSRFELDGEITDGLAVANGSVYAGTTSGSVYAIGGDGVSAESSGLEATPPADADATGVPQPAPSQTLTSSVEDRVFDRPYRIDIPDDPSFHHDPRESGPDFAVYDSGAGGITLWIVEQVAIDPCDSSQGTVPIEPGDDALIEHLRSIEQADVGPIGHGSLGGRPASVFDVTARGGEDGCSGELSPWTSNAQWFGILPWNKARLFVLDDERPAFVVEIWSDRLEAWLPKAMTIVESLRFIEDDGSDVGAPVGTDKTIVPPEPRGDRDR